MTFGSGFGGYSGRPLPLVYTRTEAPSADVVDIARVLRHLRLEEGDVDAAERSLIEGAIATAHQHLDGRTGILGRALLTQTWEAITDRPTWAVLGERSGSGFVLALPPIQAVTKVEYLTGGAYVAMQPGTWRALPRPGARLAVLSSAWPATDNDPAAYRLTFRTGYGAAAAVPAPIVSAMLLAIADLYDNRDGKTQANLVDNPTIARLLAPYSAIGV
ncbi:head-tail connector protein [Methylorubrum thiocyanatum]|uniref:head-tail connector protein n=1 Tax=Methylorubrum thiocyanatum TaxID=47958 RepID=UPI003F7DF1A9